MSRDYDCLTCLDRGVVRSPRWWDDEADPVACPSPGCLAAEERTQESDRSASQGHLRSDLAGPTPSPGGASDDAGASFREAICHG